VGVQYGSGMRGRPGFDPVTDLLFNSLLGFTFLFVVAVLYMNPVAKQGIIDPKAEYIITVTWPDHDRNDIDTYLEDPAGSIVWFRNPQAGLVHLDRDDRGMLNDVITVNGREIENPLNQEITTIRGVVTGEYVLNIHYYATDAGKPVPVTVRLDRVNPRLEVLYYETLTLNAEGDERTAFRFQIATDGSVSSFSTLQKSLVEAVRGAK
jgi:hypothetical protein